MNLTALGHQLRSRKEESEKVSLKLEGADGSRRSRGCWWISPLVSGTLDIHVGFPRTPDLKATVSQLFG